MKNIQPILPGWTEKYFQYLESINTVIDIGVCDGTAEIYKPFPNAELILVEALPEKIDRCKSILSKRDCNGEFYPYAVGKENKETVFYRHKDLPQCSALHCANIKCGKWEPITVSMVTLDYLFRDKKYKKNILLKVDTEGADYDIILGGKDFLKNVKYCILEVAIKKRPQSPYIFSDYIRLMKENNFDLLDIMRITRKDKHSPDAYIADCLFINKGDVK